MSNAIELRGLNKSFGQKQAVRDMNLDIPQGAMVGFIGPNGAGKSTTLRMVLSILFPDSGDIRVLGNDSALKAKDRIGYLPEERGVYRKMKVSAFLQHMAILKGVDRREARRRAEDWLGRVGLGDVGGKRCEELSKGMQQKVQFISSVIHEPELLILDEPFSGLDPVNMRLLRDLIQQQHAKGVTVLFSTHVMFQAEQLCQHIVMINNGSKVLDDPLSAIRARHAPRTLRFEPIDRAVDVAASLATLPQIADVEAMDEGWQLSLSDGASLEAATQAVAACLAPAKLELIRPTLEDVFIDIVSEGNVDSRGAQAEVAA
ncbi:MAG: ATP-binding cassette domain-containing protein [Lysobacteraceae bacterium]|nr:ATP-binding cassette domain-containing protein [Xanthomonadales bacterium]MCP5477279.1 ATP-binding cassette domain-containing protein [Rhodanobacteraceae bacterium]HPF73959.1 ATP-binding cassette domain-containing protein [Xanthomonadaceae bacterium]HRY00335.1 ATP-binding cassette domain-containing protein [Xanthomonadaceae bacterium]